MPLAPTDLINTDPRLGPLANNGGPTFTQALLPGSPAIDAGVAVPGVTTDQRGDPRPRASRPTSAFESSYFAAPPTVVGVQGIGTRSKVTALVLTLSEAMDAGRSGNLGNYTLTTTKRGHTQFITLVGAATTPRRRPSPCTRASRSTSARSTSSRSTACRCRA